jgi:glycerol-3-phosphate dehydrogenase (NAD(P)+)
MESSYQTIGVLGAGAWGTALAMAAQEAGRDVTLCAREPEVVESIAATRENRRFLPGVILPQGLRATGDPAALAESDAVLVVVSAQYLRATLHGMKAHLRPGTPIVICSKGIELGTGKLLHEVVAEEAPELEAAVLSGPSFARDVARGLPTAVAIAARLPVARALQAAIARPVFRPYATDDLVGVALGGAAKNVYAIACGIAEGAGLGESARAALLARGFAELLRLGAKLGARPETLMGLAGLGDLALSATSRSSRNFDLGCRIGAGGAVTDDPDAPLAEGAATASALAERAVAEGVEMPLADVVRDIIRGTRDVPSAIEALLGRTVRDEG